MAKKDVSFDDLYDSVDEAGSDDGGIAPEIDLGEEESNDQEEESTVIPKGDDIDDRSEADIQREKSWEGRLKARELKLAQDENAFNTRQGAAQEDLDTETAKDEGEPEDQTTMSEEELADFEREYPDVQHYMDTRIGKTEQMVDEAVAPLVKNSEDEALKAHFQTLEDAHADFMDVAVSEDMQLFIDEAPAYARDGMRRVLEKGTAVECIELLDDYKNARDINPAKSARTKGGKRRQQVAVQAGGRVQVPPARMRGDEDFDSLYENLADADVDD